MRAAIFRNGEIIVDQMAEPKPGAGQVLVKSLACGICGSDLHARKHAAVGLQQAEDLAVDGVEGVHWNELWQMGPKVGFYPNIVGYVA